MGDPVPSELRETGAAGQVDDQEMSDADLLERFSARRDEAAFTALVNRHGPMVQGVCRRILGNAHAAEDVFQAVFLVLVRKSATIRRPELLANWLYGVAFRIARKARIKAIRQEARERWAEKMPTREQVLDLEWGELKQVLDEEMNQLPEKYRAPLVLCYLQGKTNAQAAAQLGWPTGTMSERLSRARELLRRRLSRRGLSLSAALLAILLSQKAASAAVEPVLVATTVETAVSYAASGAAAGSLSPNLLDLVLDPARPALVSYLKTLSIALALALAIVLLAPSLGFSAKFLWLSSASVNAVNHDMAPVGCHAVPLVAPATDGGGNESNP
jgi:RNA polymerase sigma factor (sigma-70 family)